jgi:hypothetical protein
VTGRLFAFCFFTLLLFTSREPPWADSHVTYDTTENLVEHFRLDVGISSGPPWFYAIRDGRRYGVFPLGNVVGMVPSYVSYKLLKGTSFLPDRPLYAFCAHLAPALWMAGAMALLFTLLRRRGATPGWAAMGVVLTLFGTFAFVYGRSPYSEALQTILLLWVVERTLSAGERPTVATLGWLGLACGVLVNAKLVYVLVLPAVVGYLVVVHRRAGRLGPVLARSLLGVFAFVELVAVALWHNRLKTGSYWDSGYRIPEGIFSGDLLGGLHGFFLSSGKSILLYAPVTLLGMLGAATALRRRRTETIFLGSIVVIVVLFNAKFRHWHADYCWGPRHLTALLPIFTLLAFPWLPEALARGRRRLRRAAVGGLLAGGIAANALGASLYWDHYIRVLIAVKDQAGAAGWYREHLSHGHYIPSFSPLVGHAWMLRHLVARDPALDRDAPWKDIMPTPVDLSDAWSRLRPDWWLLDWVERDLVAGLVLLGLLAGGAAAGALSLRRGIRAAAAPIRRAA